MVAGLITLVAPDATIIPIRAFDADGTADLWTVTGAIIYAMLRGAKVVNLSFGTGQNVWALESSVGMAALGGTITASAGNDGTSMLRYPAAYPVAMAIAATDDRDRRADFSNYGDHISVAAPGEGIFGPYPGGQWAWWDGTSFSTAFVSGVAALVKSAGMTDARTRIESTAVSVRPSLGHGRVDAYAAVGGSSGGGGNGGGNGGSTRRNH
jgi:thermitase